METINGAGLDELLALCGGACSCATCHVHVDPGSMDMLPPMEVIEESMLEYAEHKNEFSRLSCQIPLSEALDGLRVQIAEED
jgi:2Fe-2S ferredoxin